MKVIFVYFLIFLLYYEFSATSGPLLVFGENVAGDNSIHQKGNKSEYSLDNSSDLNDINDYNNEENVKSEVNSSVKLNFSINDISKIQQKDSVEAKQFVFSEAVSHNAGVANSIAEGRGEVFTLVDTTAELEKRAGSIPSPEEIQNPTPALKQKDKLDNENLSISEPNITLQQAIEKDSPNASEEKVSEVNATEKTEKVVIEIEPKENLTEEIPSFSEWTQKQLEEAEKKKEQVNSSIQGPQSNGKSIKKRSKNYASPDCGAKIIASNPEAISPGSVLSSSRDEYKLNTCTSRIWFVVELCEAIQAKKIDLANFELFSSSPKDFSIYVSDRFPTRDWSNVGHFTARDERDIQSFDLHPHIFGKYIKFEMHSHHGSEHYCPISLFRVYGTSEFEVLETEDQPHSSNLYDEEDDETLDFDKEDVPRNLLSSATDAVMSIVKKAAEVLGNKGNTSNQTLDLQIDTNVELLPASKKCFTPTHLLVCNNCSDNFYESVYDLLSCESEFLYALANKTNVREALYNSNLCSKYGLNFNRNDSMKNTSNYSFLIIFPPKYIAALCNTLAVLQNKVVRNSSIHCFNCTKNLVKEDIHKVLKEEVPKIIKSDSQFGTEETEDSTASLKTTEEVKPTAIKSSDLNQTETTSDKKHDQDSIPPDKVSNNKDSSSTKKEFKTEKESEITESTPEFEPSSVNQENLDEELENMSTEANSENHTSYIPPVTSPPTVSQAQNKETVFVRLTNRIKALERNMSLSSQYLEELSKRYKKQVEEMQRLLDKTITTLNEENKKEEERTQKLEDQLANLTAAIESLTAERNMWITFLYWLMLTVTVFAFFWFFCRRRTSSEQPTVKNREKINEVQRRKSDDILIKKNVARKKRRPSEEALNIETHAYQEFLIDDSDSNWKRRERKRKKKKPSITRSKSITTLTEEAIDEDRKYRTIHSEINFPFTDINSSPITCKRQTSAPPAYEEEDMPNKIQDVPFVLDESEHTSVDPLVFNGFEPDTKTRNGRKQSPRAFEVKSVPDFTKTAKDSRNNTNLFLTGRPYTHKKSASVDDTKNVKIIYDSNGLSNSEELKLSTRKEKKGLKKIFKSFNFKQKVEEIQNC